MWRWKKVEVINSHLDEQMFFFWWFWGQFLLCVCACVFFLLNSAENI